MSGASKPPSIWSIKPKRKPSANSAAPSADSSSSSSSRKRPYAAIKDEDEDSDLQEIPEFESGVGEHSKEVARLLGIREKKNNRTGTKDEPGTTVSVRNVRSAGPKVSRSDRLALVSSAELIERILKKFASYRRNQTDKEYQQDLKKLRDSIHLLPFSNVDRDSVRSSGIRKALVRIVEAEDENLELPADIVLDAESILTRWRNEDFDPALLKGIELSQTIKRGAGGGSRNTKRNTHYKLEDNYPFKKNPHVPGHNGLTIGDWWPLQICALRDGAHGEMEAGISGNKEHGCLSVILSGGTYSKDIDSLSHVLYCGTLGTLSPSEEPYDPKERKQPPGIPSANTLLLLTSLEKQTPIRLLRAHKGKSKYAPSVGIRYDGLYKVTDYEVLDAAYAMYRFTLIREEGQAEVRWEGPGVRPNEVEVGERGWGGLKNIMKGER